MDSSMCSSAPDPEMWIIQGTLAWRTPPEDRWGDSGEIQCRSIFRFTRGIRRSGGDHRGSSLLENPYILGMSWAFLIGAELTIVQSRISLVNKIQKVYRSQGVQIHNRHIEIIVRQITSRVLVSEDGMSNVFSPGELIGLVRAERMGRALEEAFSRNCLSFSKSSSPGSNRLVERPVKIREFGGIYTMKSKNNPLRAATGSFNLSDSAVKEEKKH
ncbi:hypothetical protein ACS0TY_004753 [Phlomoides rotata]